MTGIEKIIAKINEDAEADYHRIVDAAKSEADGILKDAASAARTSAEAILEEVETERREIERRAVSMAGLEVRKMRLELKQKLLQQAFDQALSKLTSMPDDQYEAFLVSLASAAAQNGAELLFSEKDRTKFGAAVTARVNAVLHQKGSSVSLSEKTRPISGGVIVCNGRVEVNCAFDTLLADQREKLTAETAKILF